jgi:hypothetical protein
VELLARLRREGADMARRTKADAGERRTAGLRVQLTPSERVELNARAAAVGRGLSEFARLVLLSDAKKPAPSPRAPQAIRALSAEIRRLGNNYNQIAKRANERKALPPELDAVLQGMSQHIMAALEKVRAL